MSIYDSLNKEQKEAVFHGDGPLLILAGAGSGKTRVLTHRIAYLMEQGVPPFHILAITFTNKAAGEMKSRVEALIEAGGSSVWISTFHSMCVRILRRYIDRLGFDNNFTIYDTEDQKSIMKDICKKLQIDTKNVKERAILAEISKAKNEMLLPEEYARENDWDFGKKKICEAYAVYQQQLKKNNALDFDDLLVKTVELFRSDREVLANYQRRFQYIMVDEYQDTNTVQFLLIRLLAGDLKNICVVGDDDQSIYGFRGANIANILDFEKYFPETKVIKLEQNYRSTKKILQAANEVIGNNVYRKQKALWTQNDEGEEVLFSQQENEYAEAEFIAGEITSYVRNGKYHYKDIACLYRTNAQSRVLEEMFIREGIAYKIIGGINFYQRKEIKDLIAYLKAVDNGKDDVAVKRIINVPKRGIGAATIAKFDTFASANQMSFYDALKNENAWAVVGRGATKVKPFVDLIQRLRAELAYAKISDIMEMILQETGYRKELELEKTTEANDRINNIDEFFNKIIDYEETHEQGSLSEFLEEISLVADIDNLDNDKDYVVLMTIHSAKGLEFPKVFLCGMEEGLFPGKAAIFSDSEKEMEEERRLCYVAITRAMESLTLSCAKRRLNKGELQYNAGSRFLKEITGMRQQSGKKDGRNQRNAGMREMQRENRAVSDRSSEAATASKIFRTKPFGTDYQSSVMGNANVQVGIKRAGKLEYSVGDTVEHIKFGIGKVINIAEGGRDYEVTVDFIKAGQKKMFASFAKLKKL